MVRWYSLLAVCNVRSTRIKLWVSDKQPKCKKKKERNVKMYLGALLHLLHHPLMLLGNGQCGWVDPLVDHLALPRLEREQTLSCVTHPAPGTHTQREKEREVHTLWSHSLSACWFTNMHGWMCTYRETHWYNSPLKWNTHTHTCVSWYFT